MLVNWFRKVENIPLTASLRFAANDGDMSPFTKFPTNPPKSKLLDSVYVSNACFAIIGMK